MQSENKMLRADFKDLQIDMRNGIDHKAEKA